MNKYQQLVNEQESRLKKLETELTNLYFLTAEEIQEILEKFKDLPAEAFTEMQKLLKDAKNKQSKFFVKAVLLDKNFPKIIDQAIYSKYKELTGEMAQQQKQKEV